MATTATGLTAEAMRNIANSIIVGGRVQGENLFLIKKDGSEINVGQILFSDEDLAEILGSAATKTGMVLYSKVSDFVSVQVPPKVVEVIANQPAIVQQAAAKAAELAQSAVNLLKAYNQYPNKFIILDSLGYFSARGNEDGTFEIPDLKVRRLKIGSAGITLSESPEGGLVLRDEQGFVQAWFKSNGQTLIGDLQAPSLALNGVKKVICPIIIGQSNAEGRATPITPETDFVHNRIFMANWDKNGGGQYPVDPKVTDIRTATVPLSSQQRMSGLSVGTVIAKELIAENDESTHVVVLSAAAGGSGMLAQPQQGTWDPNYNGSNPKLYNIAVSAINKFKELVAAKYPGVPVEYRIYWVQGEADTATGQTAYAEALDNVLTGIRAAVGSQTTPITIGGLVPEWIIKTGSGAQAIRRALMDTQVRLKNVAYTDGVENGGGSTSLTDTVHYARAGAIELGKKMKLASDRAISSSADAIPHRPLEVEAYWFNNEIRIKWSEPDSRWTNFVVQYAGPTADERVERDNLDQGWTTWNRVNQPVECSETITGVTGPIKVRIKTVNDVGTSLPTIPRPVIGASS